MEVVDVDVVVVARESFEVGIEEDLELACVAIRVHSVQIETTKKLQVLKCYNYYVKYASNRVLIHVGLNGSHFVRETKIFRCTGFKYDKANKMSRA